MAKNIIVLGAGYGGILTAKKLAKKFKKNQEVEITIIDRNPYHTMLTELHEVSAGRVPEDAIKIDLKKIFAKRKVDVVLDNIENIDFDKKVLKGKKKKYSYDYLVVGTGSKPTFFGTPGAKENAFTLWSYDDAVKLKHQILEQFRNASKETDPVKRQKMLSFVVIGCGFTGIELIGEIGEWKKTLCKDFYISEDEVKLYAVDMLPKIMPILDDKLIAKAEKRLKKLGVELLLESSITEVGKDSVCINGKGCIEAETIVWAAGVESSELLEKVDGVEKKGRNRIVTNDKLQSQEYENVYVVGDNIFFIPEGEERPVPQMVENAEHSSALVANNIAADINGKEKKSYKPEFHGVMVCIGGKYGVAQVGTSKFTMRFSGFMAMFIKHLINVVYFLQVAGFNKVWTYLMHEIFHVPDNRSLVGGYFSKRSPNFWLVPLRMFLGYKWLMEGLAKLPRVLEDPSDIFLIPAKVADVTGASVAEATDTVTSASQVAEAAETVSEWGEALPVPDFIQSIVDWSMDLMFYTPDGGYTGLATVFQTLMVFGEIVVGICLIVGLFSALSSIISIGMGMMIWSSGMAPVEMLWYLLAGIALIGGSGSTFGLDYYVLPFLKKRWKKIGFVKKWYLYTE